MRTLLFVLFFSIGAAAIVGAILCDDLLIYYTNTRLLKEATDSLNRLESLNADYDVLLRQLHQDPNFINHIVPATLGTTPDEPNTVYPKAKAEQLAAAKKALIKQSDRQSPAPAVPDWIIRCGEPPRRVILFLAGALLILVSFVWFGSAKRLSD